MQAPPFTLTNESITVIWQGKSHVVQKGSPNFLALRAAIIAENWDAIPENLTVVKSLNSWAQGAFTIKNEQFYYKDEALPTRINARIVQMATRGEDPSKVLRFWERLQKNPSYRSVEQLWDFLDHKGIPLTDDGCFLAYKGVREDYKDAHSGTFDNHPGSTNEMSRNKISDDPRVECHEGFHVGALAYARSFSARTVVCKVDPENVVCVPYDSSSQKMRVCKYTVVGNHNGELLPDTSFKAEPTDPVNDDGDYEEAEADDPNYDPENDPLSPQNNDIEGSAKNYFLNEQHELPKEEKRRSKKGFAKFDKLGHEELLKESIEDLRKYAGKGLEIVGASKIPGGKVALVAKILEVRE